MTETNTTSSNDNPFKRLLRHIDRFQRRHPAFGFPYAIIKKYGDDEAGYQGALLTYYGFLSLFPLLIVGTSVIDLLTRHNPAVRDKLLNAISSYLPAIGQSVQESIHNSSKTGIALILSLLITLWGAKGVADALQHALNHVWQVPRPKRPGFPKGPLKSLGLIVGGGLGLVGTAVLSGYAASVTHAAAFTLLSYVVSICLLFCVFTFIMAFGSSSKHSFHENFPGAIMAAVGLFILQTVGIVLVKHQLKNATGAYGQFGLVLALLFWLYLQARLFLYAAELNTVKALKLWPRGLIQEDLTPADKRALKLYPRREQYLPRDHEDIEVDIA